jgi:integrase
VKHFRAMDYKDVPAFMADLGRIGVMSAITLRFLIYTAARSAEVTGARWREIDWHEQTWVVPAARTKANREHIVPLSTGALAVLREVQLLRSSDDDFIFPGRNGEAQAAMTLLMLQRRMGRPETIHGHRSAFRDWCGDEGDIPRELAEASLAHAIKDTTERAYRRKTAVARRAAVMQKWCDYVSPPVSTGIVDIQEARRGRVTAA